MTRKQLIRLGVPPGQTMRRAADFIARYMRGGGEASRLGEEIRAVLDHPDTFLKDPLRSGLAKSLMEAPHRRTRPVKYRQWGKDLEPQAVNQMENACRLPVSVAGALMPDAHPGYGLPIGGVLATENAVIPYAVGVDIACRMKMTVTDIPVDDLKSKRERLTKAIVAETRFGIGAQFRNRRHHHVLDRDWSVSPITKSCKERAWAQLGTSGSGNHFVEFGVFSVGHELEGLPPGKYVALLSHSGSRGVGAAVCKHYSRLAASKHRNLTGKLKQLAWLSLDEADGREYWAAMELMGHYAAANHAVIHRHMADHLGYEVLLDLENHHNFAWKERHIIEGRDREVIVHRKGATPAGAGVLGIIPGSMASPGFVVEGKGKAQSLDSAAHGAGRVMSRRRAKQTFRWKHVNRLLADRGVSLISAGLDEAPMVYKDIHRVMAAQKDLVEVKGRFDPQLVKMAPAGERPED